MFPPSQQRSPLASMIEWINAVVVDFPLLPVTATTRPGLSDQKRFISEVSGIADDSSCSTIEWRGGTAGLTTTKSASAKYDQ